MRGASTHSPISVQRLIRGSRMVPNVMASGVDASIRKEESERPGRRSFQGCAMWGVGAYPWRAGGGSRGPRRCYWPCWSPAAGTAPRSAGTRTCGSNRRAGHQGSGIDSTEREYFFPICIEKWSESRQEWLLRRNSPHCIRLYKCVLLLLAAAQELGERSQETLLTAYT